MELRQSERQQAKIKIALQGVSGAGKTYSSLLMAKGLVNGDLSKVAVIDTENGSADLYAHLGSYKVVRLKPPFSPDKYIKAIDLCLTNGISTIIIDSMSHSWEYLLSYHSTLKGNSFTNWSLVTKLQEELINKILQADAHVICTMRSKEAYAIKVNEKGKHVPEKIGLKPIQRNGISYEFTMVFDIGITHLARVIKDRSNLFLDKEFIISEKAGFQILEWCNNGTTLDDVRAKITTCNSLEELRQLYSQYEYWRVSLNKDFKLRKDDITKLQQSSNNITAPIG
jgi:hypothetical protein